MVTAPAETLAPAHAARGHAGHALRDGAPSRTQVPRRAEPHESMALVQRQRRILDLHKERWPWSLTPREDARVPAPHEAPKKDASPILRRLSERTAVLWRNNEQLKRRLAALKAETNAALLARKRPAVSLSMGVLSPESTSPPPRPCPPPPSSLPSSPASSCWSSPPSSPASPASSEPDVTWPFGYPCSPSCSDGPGSPDSWA